jgi:hypothetical protein
VSYYRFWRERGKLRKEYVRPADLAAVTAACEARRTQRREFVASMARCREAIAVLRRMEKQWVR